jgi:hypothetical protein
MLVLIDKISGCPFADSQSAVREDVLELRPYHSPMNYLSDETEGQPVRNNVLHKGAFRNLFKKMQMFPGAIRALQLDISECFGWPVLYDSAFPSCPPQIAKPFDAVVIFGPLEDHCPGIEITHPEIEPVRGDLGEIPRVLKESKCLFPGKPDNLRGPELIGIYMNLRESKIECFREQCFHAFPYAIDD